MQKSKSYVKDKRTMASNQKAYGDQEKDFAFPEETNKEKDRTHWKKQEAKHVDARANWKA